MKTIFLPNQEKRRAKIYSYVYLRNYLFLDMFNYRPRPEKRRIEHAVNTFYANTVYRPSN